MMKNRQLPRLIGMLAAFILSACVGGTQVNKVVLSGGIGGTGVSPWEGGIGGTGVVGTITGFGSIIVNGLHIQYNQEQEVESVTGSMTGAKFAVGQVVAVQAQYTNGRLIAERMIAQTPLVGPVESINPTAGKMRLLGETVHIMPSAELGVGPVENVRVGDNVVISGHRGADGVYASRIEAAPVGARPTIAGTVTGKTSTTVVIDNKHEINISVGVNPNVTIGDYVSVSDLEAKQGGGLVARTTTRVYAPLFGGRVTRMSVEGVFAAGLGTVPGAGPVKGLPVGRAVVFVSKKQNGEFVLDGAAQRPTEDWGKTLSITQKQTNAESGIPQNKSSPGTTSGYGGGAGSSGGGSGGSDSGGGGNGGSSNGGW